jgi:hypothetical protein
MTHTFCPLCEGKVSESMYHFVKYVLSSEENMKNYINETLTFESWKEMMINALGAKLP